MKKDSIRDWLTLLAGYLGALIGFSSSLIDDQLIGERVFVAGWLITAIAAIVLLVSLFEK